MTILPSCPFCETTSCESVYVGTVRGRPARAIVCPRCHAQGPVAAHGAEAWAWSRRSAQSWSEPRTTEGEEKRPISSQRSSCSLLEEILCVSTQLGWDRAHKHTEAPSADEVRREIGAAVCEALVERFDLGPGYEF